MENVNVLLIMAIVTSVMARSLAPWLKKNATPISSEHLSSPSKKSDV
jgi:hypothetical protein